FSRHLRQRNLTGVGALAIDVDHAGAAQTGATSELGTRELQILTDNPEQAGITSRIDIYDLAIQRESNHWPSPQVTPRWRSCASAPLGQPCSRPRHRSEKSKRREAAEHPDQSAPCIACVHLSAHLLSAHLSPVTQQL